MVRLGVVGGLAVNEHEGVFTTTAGGAVLSGVGVLYQSVWST